MPDAQANALLDAYRNLAQKTSRYINLKKIVPFQTNGKNRLKAAEELLAFAHETMDAVGIEFDKETDKKLDIDIAVKEEVVDDMEL